MQTCFHRSVVFACWGISTEGRSTALLLRNMALRVSRSFPKIIQKHDSSTQTFCKVCRVYRSLSPFFLVDFKAHKKSIHPGSDSGINPESPWIFFLPMSMEQFPELGLPRIASGSHLQSCRIRWKGQVEHHALSCSEAQLLQLWRLKNNGSQIWVWDVWACLLTKYQGLRRYHQGSCGWDDILWYSYHHCSAAFIMAIPVVYCFCFFLNLKRRGTDGQSHHYIHYVNVFKNIQWC